MCKIMKNLFQSVNFCRNLSDVDKDGNLKAEEFILAMHLVDLAKSGQPLPSLLPPELIPPTLRYADAKKSYL